MTPDKALKPGLYRLHWKSEGTSLAAVGRLHEGAWYAPVNWTSAEPSGVVSTDWDRVEKAEPLEPPAPEISSSLNPVLVAELAVALIELGFRIVSRPDLVLPRGPQLYRATEFSAVCRLRYRLLGELPVAMLEQLRRMVHEAGLEMTDAFEAHPR